MNWPSIAGATTESRPRRPGCSDDEVVGRFVTTLGEANPGDVRNALEVLVRELDADTAALFILDGYRQHLLLMDVVGDDRDLFSTQHSLVLAGGAADLPASDALPLDDGSEQERHFLTKAARASGYHTFMAIPVEQEKSAIGALHLAWKRDATASARAERILRQAAPALLAALTARAVRSWMSAGLGRSAPNSSKTGLAEGLANLCCRLAGADAATVAVVRGAGEPAVVESVPGKLPVMCAGLASGKLGGCEVFGEAHTCSVHVGARSSWKAPCRSLPGGYRAVVEVPLCALPSGDGTFVAMLGFERDISHPHSRPAAALLAVTHPVVPWLRDWIAPALALTASAAVPGVAVESVSADLEIRAFGDFEIFSNGQPVKADAFGRAKAIELVQRLVVAGGKPISRDQLIEALWPEVDPKRGENRFHVALNAARRALEPHSARNKWQFICRRGDSFFFNREASVSVDVWEFRRALAVARRTAAELRPFRDVIAGYARAVDFYRGDLLEDQLFADWCAESRQSLRRDCLDTLVLLASLFRDDGDLESSISVLRKALKLDPLAEGIHRSVVRMLWESGRRSDAREQLQRCTEILRAELGAEPLPETLRLGELMAAAGAGR